MGKANVYQTDLKVSVVPRRFPHRGCSSGCTERSVPIDPSGFEPPKPIGYLRKSA